MKNIIRSVAMMLVLIMMIGMIPMASAAGADPGEGSSAAGPEDAAPPASSEKEQGSTEGETTSSYPKQKDSAEDYIDVSPRLEPFDEASVMPYAVNDCRAAQLALVWINNEEPNPDGQKDRLIYFEFPKGVKRKTDCFILHTVLIDGKWRTAYCIEPGVKDAKSYTSDQMTMNQWIDSQMKTGNLSEAQMRAIGVVLLYGQIDRPREGDYTGLARMMATQVLVWEIAMGDRNPYPPYTRKADTHIRRLTDGAYGVEISSYFLGIPSGKRVRGIVDEYDKIVAKLTQHYKVPSFSSLRQSQAPVIELQEAGDGSYTATLQDTNGTLSAFDFQDTDKVSFVKDGNTLHITARNGAQDTLLSCSKTVPSAKNQVYYVMYNGGYQQMAASVSDPTNDPLPAYFKLKIPAGDLELKKTTDDGKNLDGWQFGIYADQACSQPIVGTQTTDNQGRIRIEGITKRTVWVKELGHTDPGINDRYVCAGPNPQKVTIASGQVNSVNFHNRLQFGTVAIQKETNTGTGLAGWKIGIYEDLECSRPIGGSPFTTNSSGKINVPNLLPGTYYAKEIDESDRFPYWEFDKKVQKVTVVSGETAAVTFNNTQLGDLKIHKNAVNGSAAEWNFQILDSGKNLIETIQTGSDGYAYSSKLQPGTYYVREIHDRDDTYWEYDAEVERQVTVVAGSQISVSYTNTQYGRIEFHKTTNTMNHLAGWTFEVRSADKELVGHYVTDETGYACTEKLAPGRYFVKEVTSDDPYWSCDVAEHTIDVTAGKTVGDSWNNIERGKGIFHKTTNTGENLQGWELTIYTDAECAAPIATVVTGEDGYTELFLEPGTYYVRETGDQNNRLDDPYWKLDESVKTLEIRAHEDTDISFSNTHFGNLMVFKTMSTNGSVEGWQFRITDADGNEVEGSPFTSDAEGLILTGMLRPGIYTVEELIPEDSLFYCKSENPQTIHVVPGETAEVTFQNAMRPGKISILKVDLEERPLAGAKFLLEWSEDGKAWTPITYSDHSDVTLGTCNNPLVTEGCLVSGEDGLIEWSNLYPGIYYRITEVSAPEGYTLLTDYAFNGQLPVEDLTVTLRVVNTRTYELPKTGSMSLNSLPLKLGLCAVIFIGALNAVRKRVD